MKTPGLCSPSNPLTRRMIWLLSASMMVAVADRVRADSANWTGGSGGDPQWSNPANWSSGLVPENPLTFPSGYNTADGAVTFAGDPGFFDSVVGTSWNIGRLVISSGSANYVLSGADLTLSQAQSAAGNGNIDFSGTATITISNNLIIPVALTNPASNIRHQLQVNNAGTMNIYGKIIKTNAGQAQLTFRGGGGGTFNIYGPLLWDTNLISRTDVSTVNFYNTGNTWTQMNVSVGTVGLGANNALPTNSILDFNQNSGGASYLRMSNWNQTLLAIRTSTPGTGANTQTVDTGTSPGGVLTLNDSGNNTFGGAIIGAGKLRKMGAGTLTFTNLNHTYTGGTLINAGVLHLGNGGTGGGIVGPITNNATLLINKSDALTLSGPISGTGALRKTGGGTTTLTGTHTYSGQTSVTNGTLFVQGTLTGAGAVSVGAGILAGTGSIGGPVTVFTNAQIQTIAAPGVGTLTLASNLTLNGTANYKFGGPTTVGAGFNDLFDIKGNLTLGNGTLNLIPVGPLAVGNTYRVANVTGSISGSLGTIANPTRYTLTATAANGQVDLAITGGANSSLVWQGPGNTWDLTSSNWLNGTTSDRFFQADAVTFDDTGLVSSIGLSTTLYPGSVTVDTTKAYGLAGSGKLSGATGITKSGPGTLVVSNANDFSGPVQINAGTFIVGNSAALGSTNGGTVVASGATLELNGYSIYNPGELVTIAGAGLNSTGAVINSTADQQNGIRYLALATNATVGAWNTRWDVRGLGGNASFSGGLYLNGYTLTKVGTNKIGMADLVMTNEGSIQIADGVLAITRSFVDGAGTIDIGANLLQFENSSTGYVNKPILVNGGTIQTMGNAFTLGSPITNLGGLTVNAGVDLTLTSAITGAGALTKSGAAVLTLAGVNTYSGPTTVSAGRLALGAGATLPNSSSISVATNAVFDSSTNGTFLLGSGRTLSGSGSIWGDFVAQAGSAVVPGSSAGTLLLSSNVTFESSSITMELGNDASVVGSGVSDLIAVGGSLNLSGVTTIKIVPLAPLTTGSPYTLMQYGSILGGSFSGTAANLHIVSDSRYSFTVLDPASTIPNIQIQVSGSATAADLVWAGGATGKPTTWDLKGAANWLKGAAADVFYGGDTVTFNDSGVTNLVTLEGTLIPAGIVLANNAVNYTFAGTGALNGGGMTNSGSGSLTVANSGANVFNYPVQVDNGAVRFSNPGGNTFVSGLWVNNGTVTVDNSAVNNFGPGPTVNGGQLVVANPAVNVLGISTINQPGVMSLAQPMDVTISSTFAGNGQLIKTGTNTLTLSGNNKSTPFDGSIAVQQGILRVGHTNALGSDVAATVVATGATLDVNALSVGTEPIEVSGAGVSGAGALVNNSATQQQNAFRSVTLLGNTTFGGIGRWDIRSSNLSSPDAALNTGGNAYSLTKVGTNYVTLVSANVDAALADISVLQGGFGYETNTTSLGDPNRTLTVASNAYVQLWQAVNPLDKKTVLQDGARLTAGSGTGGNNTVVGNISLPSGNALLQADSGAIMNLNGTITGGGSFSKIGAGTVSLGNANTFAGSSVTVAAGTLLLSNSLALGSSRSVVLTNNTFATGGSGSTIDMADGVTVPAGVSVTAYSTYNPDYRTTMRCTSGSAEWKGPIALVGDGRFGFTADPAGTTLTVSGPVTGSANLIFIRGASGLGKITGQVNANVSLFKTDGGTWQINSANNFWTNTGIAVGTVQIGADTALCPTAPLVFGQSGTSSGTLDLFGHTQELRAGLSTVTGTHRIGTSSSNDLSSFVYDGGTNVSTFAGTIVNGLNTNASGIVALTVKSGSLTLPYTNTYTGATLVQGGTLLVNGRLTNTVVTVASGGTLGGTGTLLGPVTVQSGGTFGAGTAIGRMAISNNLVLQAGSTHFVKLNSGSATNDNVVGLTSVTYGGTLALTNLSASTFTNGASFKLYSASSYAGAFDAILPATPGPGMIWVTNNLALNGTLGVQVSVSPIPPTVAYSVKGNTLQITWPADHTGWRLQAQTNTLTSVWYDVPGSTATNSMAMPIDPTLSAVFYRLIFP